MLFLYDGAEYKCKDGWGKDGKRGAHRQERVPEKAVEMLLVENSGDCRALLHRVSGMVYRERIREEDRHEGQKEIGGLEGVAGMRRFQAKKRRTGLHI